MTTTLDSAGALTRAASYATALLNRLKRDPRALAAAEDCRQTLGAMRAGHQAPQDAAAAVRARIHRLVITECALGYPWLVEFILHDIGAQVAGADGVALDAPAVAELPKGRAPKRGDYLARDIDWFFRHQVLQESEYAIAKTDLGKVGKGHSTVQKAIARVRAALNALDVGEPL